MYVRVCALAQTQVRTRSLVFLQLLLKYRSVFCHLSSPVIFSTSFCLLRASLALQTTF